MAKAPASPESSPKGKDLGVHTADPMLCGRLKELTEEMRKNPTEAGKVLWEALRANGLGVKFRQQHIIEDQVIKLNDYLLTGACKKEEERSKKDGGGRIPIQLLAVANLSNQLLRAGTSIGANNAEATNAISKTDFKSKSLIALKEARESLYWIKMLYRNKYIDDKQFESIYADCEELVRVLVHRCKKLNDGGNDEQK